MNFRPVALLVIVLGGIAGRVPADEPIFSGPQVGEALSSFKVVGVFDDQAGKELDFVAEAAGKPLVLIFVHDVNRQSISMTRVLSQYTLSRAADGLATGIIWLDDDTTEAESTLKRIRHALTPKAPTGISPDGREGPGSYGLNRNVMLTILVGKAGKVTANYALIQPSLQADLPKILASVVEVAGGTVPALADLPGLREMMQRSAGTAEALNLRPLLAPVIQRDATPEEVDQAARAVEEHCAQHEPARKEVGRIAKTIVESGKLTNYGTERAREYLRKWAEEFNRPAEQPANETVPPATSPPSNAPGDAE